MGKSLNNATVFKSGTWNGKTFTDDDLDEIVSAFNELQLAGRVPVKLGHNDEQPFTDGQPAMGWVSKLWRIGGTLVANFTDIPTQIYEAVKAGLYKFTSIELLQDAVMDGKEFPYVLDAVAFLGADPPAVRGLDDLQKLALTRSKFTSFGEVLCFTRNFSTNPAGDLSYMNELEQAQAEAHRLKADNEALRARVNTQESQARGEKIRLSRDKATEILESAVRAKKITPAQREDFRRALKIDDDSVIETFDFGSLERLVGVTMQDAKRIIGDKQAFSRDPGTDQAEDGTAGDVCESLVEQARKHAAATGIDVFAASNHLARTSTKFARQFLGFSFEQN